VARRKGNKIRKLTRRAAYGTVRATIPKGVRRRVRAAIGPSKAEERLRAQKAERVAEKEQARKARQETAARKAEERRARATAKAPAKKDATESPSGVGPE
jgi:hypothetical protein